MWYKGIETDKAAFQRPYTLNDIPDSAVNNYLDVVPRDSGESSLSYRQRIVNDLNAARLRVLSFIASHTHNVDKQALRDTNYDPAWGNAQFNPAQVGATFLQSQYGNLRYGEPREFVALDIETDDKNRPITISALKLKFNIQEGCFEIVDRFQRFYTARNSDLYETAPVHRMSHAALQRLRSQQARVIGQGYSHHYNPDEREILKEFLGDSVIVGHNIVDFDLQQLFPGSPINNQTIDTLTAARNMWPDRKNDLDSVFQRLFGKTMEEAGLPHHISSSDVIATAMIAGTMLMMEGATPNAIRYVATHGGTHLAPRELNGKFTTQVIKGFYNQYKLMEKYMADIGDGITIEELIGGTQRFEYGIDKNTGKRTKLPPGFSYSNGNPDFDDTKDIDSNGNPDFDVIKDINLFSSSIAEVGDHIEATAKEMGEFAQQMSKVFSDYSFSDTRRFRLSAARISDKTEREKYIQAAGYGENETDLILKGIKPLIDVRKQQEFAELDFGSLRAYARSLSDDEGTVFDRGDSIRKIRALNKALRRGRITESQYNELSLMDGSYEDLSDSMDEVIEKNTKLSKIYQAIGNIPMYNFERLEQAFKGEVSGIKNAARGVVPSFLYDPLSRLTDAGMNGLNAYLADIKAGVRATGAIGNGLMAAGMEMLGTGNPLGVGVMIGGGIFKAGTQIFGNYREAQITKWGENIQNNLNTLGFLQDMILMPFKLLGNAIKLATRGLTLFSSGLRAVSGLMTGGLTNLQAMGNPLTGLTGSGYGSYMGSLSADAASLLGAGTLNSVYNDFAAQRMSLYTTGKLDTKRLVAASMLGVFNEAYGYTMNEEEAFGAMIDKLLASTSGKPDTEKKRIYAMANDINPNLGSVLQSMETLGITSYSSLQKPRGMWGYSEEAYNSYRPGWQRAQWEYQYAGTQWDTTKRRLATSLWNMGGKDIYNAFNATMSAVASGDWDTVGAKVKEIWTIIKDGAENVWSAISKTFGLGNKSFAATLWGALAKGLTMLRDNILPVMNGIWDAIIDTMIDKFSNFISYLSTIKLDFKELVKAIQGKEHGDILTYLGDVGVGKGAYTGEFSYGKDGQDFASLLTLEKVASAYDKAMGKAPGLYNGYAGTNYYGIAKHAKNVAGGHTQYYSNYEDYKKWMQDTVKGSSLQDLTILSNMLEEAGLPGNITPENVDKYVDFLMQHDINASGSAFLHSQWGRSADTLSSPSYRISTELNNIRKKGVDIVGTPLLNAAINYAENKAATLNITLNGKDVAAMSVSADGTYTVSDTRNSRVSVGVVDGMPKFMIEASTQIQ